jgi:putative phage-type endonuclease
MANIEVLADLDEIPPNSPRWYELRRTGWGGSDAAALVGVSPYRDQTPLAKWSEKMTEGPGVNARWANEDDIPEYIQWGHILEEPVRREFCRRTQLEVVRFPKMVRSIAYPFMLANVDGLIVDTDDSEAEGQVTAVTGIYEGKTSRKDWWDDGEVVIPIQYVIQGYHYMVVLELDVLYFACLVGGQLLRVAVLERNDKLMEDLVAIEAAMWQNVLDGIPPDASGADVDMLRRHWTPIAGKSIELTAELAMSVKRRAGLHAQKVTIEDEIKDIDAALMEFMGDAEQATWKEQVAITWKQDAKGRLQGKELAAAYPDIAKQFTGEPSRRFIPKELTA